MMLRVKTGRLVVVQARSSESTMSSSAAAAGDRDATEQRITVMLISVVVVFLVCQLPQALTKLYSVYFVSTPGAMTRAHLLRLRIAGNVCNLLVMLNAAVNFVLYSALSAKFRQTFRRTFCRCSGLRGGGVARSRRGSASVLGVPLTTTALDDAETTRSPRRPPRTGSTNVDDVTAAETSGQILFDGAANT